MKKILLSITILAMILVANTNAGIIIGNSTKKDHNLTISYLPYAADYNEDYEISIPSGKGAKINIDAKTIYFIKIDGDMAPVYEFENDITYKIVEKGDKVSLEPLSQKTEKKE